MSPRWTAVDVSDETYGENVERLAVPGGWLYRSWCYRPTDAVMMSIAFVPDPDLEGHE